MSQNEMNEIKKVFPTFTRKVGEAMWCMFTGYHSDGTYRNVYLPSGQVCQHTFRTWGQIIADARGHKKEDYSTYWSSHTPQDKVRSVERKFKKAGWKFGDETFRLDTSEQLRKQILSNLPEKYQTHINI